MFMDIIHQVGDIPSLANFIDFSRCTEPASGQRTLNQKSWLSESGLASKTFRRELRQFSFVLIRVIFVDHSLFLDVERIHEITRTRHEIHYQGSEFETESQKGPRGY
jgi:hypothetical protein